MFENETPIAWRAMPYRCRVYGADDAEVGTAESLLADDKEDIFHGLAVKRQRDGKMVEIPAARINTITEKGVATDLNAGEVAALPPYREERWYHIGWGGFFRKHPEWDRTSNT
jgi:hypothetical protein